MTWQDVTPERFGVRAKILDMDTSAAVFQMLKGFVAPKNDPNDLSVIDLQVGRQVHRNVPGNMRTELWLSVLHRGRIGDGYAAQYRGMLAKVLTRDTSTETSCNAFLRSNLPILLFDQLFCVCFCQLASCHTRTMKTISRYSSYRRASVMRYIRTLRRTLVEHSQDTPGKHSVT